MHTLTESGAFTQSILLPNNSFPYYFLSRIASKPPLQPHEDCVVIWLSDGFEGNLEVVVEILSAEKGRNDHNWGKLLSLPTETTRFWLDLKHWIFTVKHFSGKDFHFLWLCFLASLLMWLHLYWITQSELVSKHCGQSLFTAPPKEWFVNSIWGCET